MDRSISPALNYIPIPANFTQLMLSLNAMDIQIKHLADDLVLEFCFVKLQTNSLKNINSSIGVASYQLTKSLPMELKAGLPSIKELTERLTN